MCNFSTISLIFQPPGVCVLEVYGSFILIDELNFCTHQNQWSSAQWDWWNNFKIPEFLYRCRKTFEYAELKTAIGQ